MIYGVSGPRSFDGLSPELIFYGSTSTTMSETDAAAILSNQYSTFVVSDQTKLSQTNVTNITVYQTTKELIVKGNTSNNATATIVDITGKIVNKSILNAGSENVIKLNQLKGMYIVTLNNGANTQKVKIIVK
jgi:hypothetical protein